jgi:hypothetical protein
VPWMWLISGRWLRFLFKLFLYDDGGTKFMWLWEFGAPLEIAARALLLSQGLYEGPTLGESGEWSNVPFAFNHGSRPVCAEPKRYRPQYLYGR